MNVKIAYLDTICMLGAGLLYAIKAVTGLPLLWPLAIIALILLVIHLPMMSRSYRVPAWLFTICGISFLVINHAPLEEWAKAFTSMMSSVAIISMMQILSIPVSVGKYDDAISCALKKYAKNQGVLYCIIEILSHFLCSILNLGEVIIVLNSINEEIRDQIKDDKKYIGSAISRGHCTAFLWAPGSITVIIILQIFHLDWSDYFFPGFIVALVGLILAGAGQYVKLKDQVFHNDDVALTEYDIRKVITISGVIVIIIIGILALGKVFPKASGSEVMVLDVLIVSMIWLLTQIRAKEMKGEIRKFVKHTLPGMGNLNAFFITMGLFSESLQYAGFDRFLNGRLEIFRQMPGLVLLFSIPLMIIAFSLIGVHPMVSLIVLGPVLQQFIGNTEALQLALSAALGCCLSYMISPFAGLILLLSQLLDVPPHKLSLEYNLIHGIVYYILGTLIIYYLF